MKKRLDQLLVEKEFFSSRTRAQAAIMEGRVFIDDQRKDKSGERVPEEAEIKVKGEESPYVSRGGIKLERALKEFDIRVSGKIALDVGASTGGFTDCLLKHGAAKIYAIDVGYGQLAWGLRQDARVKVVERTNIRYLILRDLGLRTSDIEICTIDVSFISLSKVLPAVYNLLAAKAEVIALVKPQFEARRGQVGKGGIVRDEKVRREVVEKVGGEAGSIGFTAKGVIESPITGADGNQEYFIHLIKEQGVK